MPDKNSVPPASASFTAGPLSISRCLSVGFAILKNHGPEITRRTSVTSFHLEHIRHSQTDPVTTLLSPCREYLTKTPFRYPKENY